MKGQPWGSLRLRLMLLVVLAVIPAVALLVHSDLQRRQRNVERARAQVLEAAHQASRSEDRAIGQARQILQTLSHIPPILQQDSAKCREILVKLKRDSKGYSTFLAITTDGLTFATSSEEEKVTKVADRSWFKSVLQSGQFVVGDYIVSRVTGKPVLPLGFPLKDENGKVVTVLGVGMQTDYLIELLEQTQLPADAHLVVIDTKGVILAHNPPEPEIIGKPIFEREIAENIGSLKEGIFEGPDAHGERRLYGFTRLGNESSALYVIFSIPVNDIYAEPNAALLRDLSLAGLAALLALLVSWFVGTASMIRPVQRLLEMTQRVTAGDLEARVGGPYGTGELGLLTRSFDQMAQALYQRQKEQESSEEALRQSEVRFQTVADFTYDWEWWRGMDGRFLYVSPSCKRLTGYTAQEFMEDPELFMSLVHPEDRDLVASRLDHDLYDDKPISEDFRIVTKAGKTIWIEHNSQPVSGPGGEPLGRRASNRDGTERRKVMDELARQNALKYGQADLADLIRGDQDVIQLSHTLITFLCEHLGFQVGLLYLARENGSLELGAGYAHQGTLDPPPRLDLGQGLVGQAALKKDDIVLKEVPEGYLSVSSGLGKAEPKAIHIKPIIHEDRVEGVLELGTLGEPTEFQSQFLDSVADSIAIALSSAEARTRLSEALKKSRQCPRNSRASRKNSKRPTRNYRNRPGC